MQHVHQSVNLVLRKPCGPKMNGWRLTLKEYWKTTMSLIAWRLSRWNPTNEWHLIDGMQVVCCVLDASQTDSTRVILISQKKKNEANPTFCKLYIYGLRPVTVCPTAAGLFIVSGSPITLIQASFPFWSNSTVHSHPINTTNWKSSCVLLYFTHFPTYCLTISREYKTKPIQIVKRGPHRTQRRRRTIM